MGRWYKAQRHRLRWSSQFRGEVNMYVYGRSGRHANRIVTRATFLFTVTRPTNLFALPKTSWPNMESSRDHSTGKPEDDTAARTPITDEPLGYERYWFAATTIVRKIDVSSYYNSKSLSDITIRYGDRVFYGHRILLCGFSHWFRAAFTGEFKVSQ